MLNKHNHIFDTEVTCCSTARLPKSCPPEDINRQGNTHWRQAECRGEPFISFTQPQGDEIHCLVTFLSNSPQHLKDHRRNILWWVERRKQFARLLSRRAPLNLVCVCVFCKGFMMDFSTVEIQWMVISQLADQKEQKYLMQVLIISSGSISFMQVRLKVHFQHYSIKK